MILLYLGYNECLKGTIMQTEKALINDRLHVSNLAFLLFTILG